MADMKNQTEALDLDNQYIEDIYAELGVMDVELDADPLVFGPKRLNNKVAVCRKMLSRCERVFNQVSADLHRYRRAHLAEETNLELKVNDLLATDPHVRAGPNVADRQAIASTRLREEEKEVHRLAMAVNDLTSVLIVVKAKRTDLKDIQGRLRDQIRLCQEEIGLGSVWGSQHPQAGDLTTGQTPTRNVLDDVLHEIEGEYHLDPIDYEDEDEEEDGEAVTPELTPEADVGATPLSEYPQLGYCSECGKPCHETPSGPTCENGHGGASWTKEPPAETEPVVEPSGPEPLESYSQVGFCSVCGNPSYETPTGPVCTEGHEGADVLNEPPLSTQEIQETVGPAVAQLTPEDEGTTDLPGETDEPSSESVLPGTAGDEEIDTFLDGLPTPEPKRSLDSWTPLDEGVIDDLLNQFEEIQ